MDRAIQEVLGRLQVVERDLKKQDQLLTAVRLNDLASHEAALFDFQKRLAVVEAQQALQPTKEPKRATYRNIRSENERHNAKENDNA